MKGQTTQQYEGAIKALLAEYEKSINEIIDLIENIKPNQLMEIVDPDTVDEDCKSIQTILTHVVQSGYAYFIEMRKWMGEEIAYKDKVFFDNSVDYIHALIAMFKYSESLFIDYPDIPLFSFRKEKKMKVFWGQRYDVEQLFEHAIVHNLRHRRQLERFKRKVNFIK